MCWMYQNQGLLTWYFQKSEPFRPYDLIDYSKLNSTFRQQADDAMAAYKNAADDDERNAALDTLNAFANAASF